MQPIKLYTSTLGKTPKGIFLTKRRDGSQAKAKVSLKGGHFKIELRTVPGE